MNIVFLLLTFLFIIVSAGMILIILVQRPQGGGLAGAFGGAGGGGTESVFGGRVGDALTYATVVAFGVYLSLAITLNLLPARNTPVAEQSDQPAATGLPEAPAQGTPSPEATDTEGNPIPLTPLDGAPPDLELPPPDTGDGTPPSP